MRNEYSAQCISPYGLYSARFPDNVGGCFVAGTLVHTDKGLAPIEQLCVGDHVLSQPEITGEKAYRRVINTFVYDEKTIRVLKFAQDDFPSINHQCYVTENHPFWVEGVGWTTAGNVEEGTCFQLVDGRRAVVLLNWPIWRTPEEGFGWVAESPDEPDEVGHVVDFRTSTNFSKYNIWEADQAPARYVEANIEYLAGLRPIIDGDDPLFKTRVYNIQVEGFHTYYINEIGVWVHNANCAGLAFSAA